MKTYYFNVRTSKFLEIKVDAPNLSLALGELLEKLLINNEPFKVLRNYYSDRVHIIPEKLYKEHFSGYSF